MLSAYGYQITFAQASGGPSPVRHKWLIYLIDNSLIDFFFLAGWNSEKSFYRTKVFLLTGY